MSNYIAAITAIQGTLFIQYIPPGDTLGTLFTLYPPSTPLPDTLLYNAQPINLQGPVNSTLSRLTLDSASLSFTASQSQTQTGGNSYRFDLLLALNMQQQTPPVLLRISNQTPLVGTQPLSTYDLSWTATDQSASYGISTDTRRAWLASGASLDANSIQKPEGTAQFQLLTSSIWNKIFMYDVSLSPFLDASTDISYLNNLENPKIVRLLQSNYYAAVVGSCGTSTIQPTTCISLIDAQMVTPYLTNMPYDPYSCIAAGNGIIIMATPNGIWSNQFTNQSSIWKLRQPPSFKSPLPGAILDCAVVNSKLYAVLQGDAQKPTIASIDLRGANWDWQFIQLTEAPNSGSGGGDGSNNNNKPTESQPGNSSGNASKGISTGAIAAIVVVAALLFFGVGFFLWRRRNTKKSGGLSSHIEKQDSSQEQSLPKYVESRMIAQQPLPTQSYTSPAVYHPGQTDGSRGLPGYTQHENMHQQPHPPVSRSWSSNSPMVYHSSQPGGFAPIVAPVVSNNPGAQYIYSSAASTNSGMTGDKQELTEEQDIRPESVTSNPFVSPRLTNAAYAPTPTNTTSQTGEYISPSDYRTQEILSPGLANAQLILKRTQTP
ncbi:hypothetical protein BGZ76_008472 [Entomortierella beljakovae]|nr:hypothetical protein BGZ76_008472 [Entomortierella beljakovae]